MSKIVSSGGLAKLLKHKTIALDFDGTIIMDPKSPLLWPVINDDQRVVSIVTFRYGNDAQGLERDLGLATLGQVSMNRFAHVISCPPNLGRLWHWWVEVRPYANNPRKVDRKLEAMGLSGMLTFDDLRNADREIRLWKGKMAHSIGATVLVDDLPDMVLPGCRQYGIEFIETRAL